MGISSFSAMVSLCAHESHFTWNQDCWCQASQPHDPEVLDVISILGRCKGGGRKDIPFHCTKNSHHHARSARNEALSRMGGSTTWWVVHCVEQVNHSAEKGPARAYHLPGMVEKVDE